MEYRVQVKEVRKTSNACDACKRRKGKCSGTIPCTHCKDCGIECSYLQGNKKRGPTKRRKKSNQESKGEKGSSEGETEDKLAISPVSTTSPSIYEHTLSATFEKCSLVDLYLNTMAQGTQSSNRQKLLNPQTLAQKMRTSAVMAFVSRGIGQLTRADQCAADARVLAGQLIEDKSYDAAEAFIALSGYFPLHDHRNLMYLGIAHNISKALPEKTIDEQRLYNFSLIGSTVLDLSMDTSTKRRILKLHGPSLLAQIKEPSPMDILLTAMTKFYCNLNPCLVEALNIEKLCTLSLKDVHLTKEEADVLMADVVIMEYLVLQQQRSNGKTLRFLIKIAKILTLWLSGNTERALKEADATIDWDSFDAIHYLSAATLIIEVPQAFWALVLFYARYNQIEKAEKVYHMFVTVAKLYGQADLITTFPTPAALVAAFAATPPVSSPIPSSLTKTEQYSPLTSTDISSLMGLSHYQHKHDNNEDSAVNTGSTIINIPYVNCSPTSTPSPTSPPSPMMYEHTLYDASDVHTYHVSRIIVDTHSPSGDNIIMRTPSPLDSTYNGADDDDMNSIFSLPTTPPIMVSSSPRVKGEEDFSFLEELLMH